MTGHRNPGIRMFCFFLCLLCFAGFYQPAVATEEDRAYATLVRIRPKEDSLPIGQMEDGAAVTVLGTKGAFYKVDCYDMVGYIARSQLLKKKDERYYVNCKTDSPETVPLTYTPPGAALQQRHELLELAKKQLGARYVYGAARPGAFDCSGLTFYLYKKHGIPLNRRASLQMQNGVIVPKEAMQVGDLVFFRATGNYPADHVGIYAGNNRIIHASTKRGVEYADLDEGYCRDYFLCARRIIITQAATPEPITVGRSISFDLRANSVSGRTA